MGARFETRYELKPTSKEPDRRVVAAQIFAQPPRPHFRQVTYDSPPVRLLFDFLGDSASWRLDRIVEVTERVRDAAARRLTDKLPGQAEKIHNTIVGRRDADEADKTARVRVTPLPSIGHLHADHAIRRVIVEIPPNCPLRTGDLEWAFSGLLLVSERGEILCELAPPPYATCLRIPELTTARSRFGARSRPPRCRSRWPAAGSIRRGGVRSRRTAPSGPKKSGERSRPLFMHFDMPECPHPR
jgi:CRISPR-associated protein Csb2